MNENHYNHNSRQKEICFPNQNFGTTKAKAHYRTTKSRGQKKIKFRSSFYDSDNCIRFLDLEACIATEQICQKLRGR